MALPLKIYVAYFSRIKHAVRGKKFDLSPIHVLARMCALLSHKLTLVGLNFLNQLPQ
jgi:hypothetical protein